MVLFSARTVAGFSTTVQSKLNASQCVILKFLGPLFKVKSKCSMWWLKPVIRASIVEAGESHVQGQPGLQGTLSQRAQKTKQTQAKKK